MGEDTPEAVILTCPGCDTQFRLKPKKGSLPDGPVACPKCATDIPVVDSNLSEASTASEAPERATLSGGGPVTPSTDTSEEEKDEEVFGGFPDEDHSFADINLSENASQKTGPKQTFLGMGPSSLKAVLGEETSVATPDEPTQLVDREDLGTLRESSAVDEDADDGGFRESPTSGRLRRPRQLDEENEFSRETSEQKTVTPSDLRETAEGHSVEASLDDMDDDADPSPASEGHEDEGAESTNTSKRPDFAKSPRERGSDEHAEDADDEASEESPKKAVLGKLNLKKKLAARLKRNKAKDESTAEQADEVEEEPTGVEEVTEPPENLPAIASKKDSTTDDDRTTFDSDDQETGKKPSLSELLKKAREKSQSGSGLPRPKQSTTRNQRPKPTGEKLDRALQDIADETAQALTAEESEADEVPSSERSTKRLGKVSGTERLDKVSGPRTGDSKKRSSKEMMDLLRRKVAEKDQPGAASERRGSGYIRLPTAEIQDVLGQGTYRLRVEDIVYEPVDKDGLTKLIKRGVLLGAAEIAEADGDWMPVQEHPVFHELRRKMAKEAHDLLADYRVDPEESAEDIQDEEVEVTGAAQDATDTHEAPDEPKRASTPPPKPTDIKEDEDQEDASEPAGATALQAEPDSDAADDGAPTTAADLDEEPQEEAEAPAQPEPEDDGKPEADHSFELPKSESSLEFPVAASEEPEKTPESKPPRDDSRGGTPLSYPAIDPSAGPDQATGTDEVIPADEYAPAGGGGRRALIIVLAILAAGAVLAALALSPIGRPYLEQYVGPIGGSSDESAAKDEASKLAPDDGSDETTGITAAIDAASSDISSASKIPLANAEEVSAMADDLNESGDAASAASLLGAVHASQPENGQLTLRYINALLESRRFTEARREIAAEVARGNDDQALRDAFEQATEADPDLGAYEPVTLASGDNADTLRAYPRWEQMNFQVVQGDQITAVFKPSQQGWERGWRDEVAAWRLCEIMTCHFEIPRNRPARVTRSEMETLLKDGSAEAQDAYRRQLEQLDWQREDIDGQTVDVVYGTLKDWPGAWAPFPIEITNVWRPWLSVPGASLDKPVEQALSELEDVQDGRFYRQLMDQLDDATTRRVARELSTILVFDFLTNNWDRFVSDESRYGVNNSFANGHFVSLNNGTAFQTRASTRVKGRFGWTSRFSASTLASMRLMEPEFVSSALYPDPTGLDDAKLEVFWAQRRRALDRVESLSQARGADRVVAFD
ncbi:MAG: tetratricopeptide repeat protein [Myxococcota bacterium]